MSVRSDAAVARPRRRRRVIVVSGTVAVAVVVAVVLLLTHPWLPATDAAAQSRTVTAQRTTLQQTVGATGTIAPAQEADLSFGSSGTVESVDVQVGQKVTAGEALAAIGTASLQDAVAVAQAQVTQAQAAVDAGGSSVQQSSAQAQLASAQAQLSQAQTALSDATLTSPIAGVVAAVNVSVGSQVGTSSGTSAGAARSTSGSGSSFGGSSAPVSASSASSADISVISTSSWIVNASVSSTDLSSLKPGLQAQITPAGATQPVFGTVQSIGVVASSGSTGASQFPVTIAVTGSPKGLYAGTSATVTITVKQLQNVLAVPTFALHTANGTTTVTVVHGDTDVTTPVTVGQVFGAQTQVLGGLKAGDEVLLPSFNRPTTGSGTGTTTGGRGGFGGGGFGGGFGGGGFGGGNRPGGATGGGQ